MPSYHQLHVDQLSELASVWLRQLLEAIETLDVDAYVALMADDVELMLNNGAVVLHGHDQVRDALGQAWAQVASILHNEINAYGDDTNLVHESIVETTLKDGSRVTARSTAWIDRNAEGQMLAARIYGDPS